MWSFRVTNNQGGFELAGLVEHFDFVEKVVQEDLARGCRIAVVFLYTRDAHKTGKMTLEHCKLAKKC